MHYRDVIMGAIASQITSLFRRRSKKTSKLRVTGLCAGNSPGPVNSPHKEPATRKRFPFDDVIMVHISNEILSECVMLQPHQSGSDFVRTCDKAITWTNNDQASLTNVLATRDPSIMFITIHIGWEIRIAVTHLLAIRPLQFFALDTTAQLGVLL